MTPSEWEARQREEEEKLRKVIDTHEYLLVDTCSLMHPYMPEFLQRAMPYLKQYKKPISTIDRVQKEVDKHIQSVQFDRQLHANAASQMIQILKDNQVFENLIVQVTLPRAHSANDTFADPYLIALLHLLYGHTVCFITQDANLIQDVQEINGSSSIRGMQIDVYSIQNGGFLKNTADDANTPRVPIGKPPRTTAPPQTVAPQKTTPPPLPQTRKVFSREQAAAIIKNGMAQIPDGYTAIAADAFYGNQTITRLILPDSITEIGDRAFFDCGNLTQITFSKHLQTIGRYAFSCCVKLQEIVLPESIIEIQECAFSNADLHHVVLPKSDFKMDEDAFLSCSSLRLTPQGRPIPSAQSTATQKTTPQKTTPPPLPQTRKVFSREQAAAIIKNGTAQIPDGYTAIAADAFYGNQTITRLILPDSITEIGDRAFFDCGNLTQITFSKHLQTIGESAFSGCVQLEEVILPESVTEIQAEAFSVCPNLCHVVLPQSNFKLAKSAFFDCSLLHLTPQGKPIVPPHQIFTAQFSPQYMKNGIAKIPSGFTEVGEGADELQKKMCRKVEFSHGLIKIGTNAFSGCERLYEVAIPNSVTQIAWFAFQNCESLTHVTLPDNLLEICAGAFRNCSKLSHIVIPAGVVFIGNNAFENCTALKELVIPASVMSIYQSAFRDCHSLTSVTILGKPQIDDSAFQGCENLKNKPIG